MTQTLKFIKFTDIYLGSTDAWLSGVPGTLDPVPVPHEHQEETKALRRICEELHGKHAREDFPLRHNGIGYRASIINSLDEMVFVLRRFPDQVPKLDELGIHPFLVNKLLAPGLSGLIVIGGAFGQGKTTTAASTVVARLALHGGVAVTAEDPPEMPLQGKHGEGVCYQTWVEQGGFAHACRQASRWAPSMIFLGEIRDNETAAEALRASINGRLVICTTHADSVITAIERLYALANGAAGSSEDVASLLSSGLLCVLQQRLVKHGEVKKPQIESLWVDGDDEKAVRSTILARRFPQLSSIIQIQQNQMFFQQPPKKNLGA